MDFIERLFGIAPDGGNGALELSIFLLCVVVVGGLLLRKYVSRRRTLPGPDDVS